MKYASDYQGEPIPTAVTLTPKGSAHAVNMSMLDRQEWAKAGAVGVAELTPDGKVKALDFGTRASAGTTVAAGSRKPGKSKRGASCLTESPPPVGRNPPA